MDVNSEIFGDAQDKSTTWPSLGGSVGWWV